MLDFLKMLLTPEFFFSIIRISAPILFATLAAIVVEKAGFCNIGLEGLMMFSALTGSLVSYYAHSWVWGLLAALAIGVLMSLMMGFFACQLKTDITLVGIAVNMMGSGGTLFLCKDIWLQSLLPNIIRIILRNRVILLFTTKKFLIRLSEKT